MLPPARGAGAHRRTGRQPGGAPGAGSGARDPDRGDQGARAANGHGGSRSAGPQAWLLANHGAVTVGATLDAAWIRMESLEHGARIIWTARMLGRVNELSPEALARLRREQDA